MLWTNKLLKWYYKNRRNLPWRENPSPYNIWLSEIILQQTRVSQGVPYYLRIIKKYPRIKDLANAKEDEILKIWQGLGYYSRALSLHLTAKHISYNLKGVFPESIEELKKLKGIGDYTASAIASICFGVSSSVVDGNVYRVLSRYFGIETPINSSLAYNEFKLKANKLMGDSNPSDFNQAIMEFGAIQCIPRSPNCLKCVFKNKCVAFNTGKINHLPVKRKKKKVKSRYFNFIIFENNKHEVVLLKRLKEDIWHKLYQFPLIESGRRINFEELKLNKLFINLDKQDLGKIKLLNKNLIKHRLSHQNIFISFWKVKVKDLPSLGIVAKNLKMYPVPKVIEKYIDSSFNFEC